jgi:hypothetical protein
MSFLYRLSKQLYQRDDSNITMEGLDGRISVLDKRMEAMGLSLSTDIDEPATP